MDIKLTNISFKSKIGAIPATKGINSKRIPLKELNLSENEIKDITVFEKVKFINLQKLDLHNNKISDISVLDKNNDDKKIETKDIEIMDLKSENEKKEENK